MDEKIIDRIVTKENLLNDIYNIYCELFDKINQDDLVIKELQGGYVNSIVKAFKKDDEKNSFIFRTYSLKLNAEQLNEIFKGSKQDENNEQNFIDTMLDRSVEYKVMKILSGNGLCKNVIAKYRNGIIYPFTNGVTGNGEIFLKNEFQTEMSVKLAKLHSLKIDLPEIKFKTHFERMNSQMAPMLANDEMEKKIEEIKKSINFPFKNFPTLNNLKFDENCIIDKLRLLGLEDDLAFCHNDLNQMNIIWNCENKLGDQIGLIDLEMAMNHYYVLELGYLFVCFMGHFIYDINPNNFPNDEYRLKFLRNYLKEKYKLENKKIDDKEFENNLELLFIKTNLAICFSLIGVLKLIPLFDLMKETFQNDEMKKISEGDDYYYCKIADKAFKIYFDNKDRFIKLADNYLEKLNS